jgi:hypothetical protein
MFKKLLPLLLLFAGFQANAAPIQSATWQAPGGTTWSGSGGITEGGATWNYSGFDTNSFDDLYWGLDQTNYGTLGAGLDGNLSLFSLVSIAGTTATWYASTTWYHSVTLVSTASTIRLTMDLTAGSWTSDLASIGLDDIGVFGDLGAVANVGGNDFSVDIGIEANTGSGWQNLNGPSGVQQHIDNDGDSVSSFATTFYYTEPQSVLEPSILALMGVGLAGLGFTRRRKKLL